MYADVQLSTDALSHAATAIGRATHKHRIFGLVIAFARLLRDDAIIASALRDLQTDGLARDAAKLAEIEASILEDAEGVLFELGQEYRQRKRPWRSIVDGRPELILKSSEELSLASGLERVANPFPGKRYSISMSPDDLVAFGDQIPKLNSEIAKHQDDSLGNVSAYLDKLATFGSRCIALHEFNVRCSSASTTSIAQRFAKLLGRWEQTLAAGPSGPDWKVPDTDGLEHDAQTLASRIELFLNGRRSRRLVLLRAKVYFEHFFYQEAREVLRAEEQRVARAAARGKRGQARRERVLRRHLDRYIFQEGFFPITEMSASRGNLDLLLSDSARVGIRPLVAEIKQAASIVPDNIGKSEVQAAVADARGEIQRYVGHLRGRPGWESIEPIVVVFHTSGEDVSELNCEDLILVDIGSQSPSQLRAPGED